MRMRVLAAVSAVFVLVGCGSAGQPGAAVVVDDEAISTGAVDEAADVICALTLEQQPDASFPVSQVRTQAAVELALAVVAQDVADEEGIEIARGDVEVGQQERRQLADRFPDLDADAVVRIIESGTRVREVAEVLGARELGEDVTEQNLQEVRQAGRLALLEQLGARDTTFSPRYEIGDLTELVDQPGHLTVPADPASEEESAQQAADVPATQTCA